MTNSSVYFEMGSFSHPSQPFTGIKDLASSKILSNVETVIGGVYKLSKVTTYFYDCIKRVTNVRFCFRMLSKLNASYLLVLAHKQMSVLF